MHRRSRLLHNRRHCVVSRLYRDQQLLRDALFPRGTPATEGRCFHSSEVSASPCPSQDRVVSTDVGMCAERSDARAPLQRQSDADVPLSTDASTGRAMQRIVVRVPHLPAFVRPSLAEAGLRDSHPRAGKMRGPSDLSTTKLYTHVLDRGPGAARSALELMSRGGGGTD